MKSTKYIFAAALVVLALGCNKEQVAVDGTPDGEEVAVTFAAELPGTVTKAIGDGLTAKNLSVAVYDDASNAAGTHIVALDKKAVFDALHTTVEYSLVKGKTYHFIFWAQAEGAPYTFDPETKKVAIDYAGAANDEKRDAFYAVKTLKVTGPATEPVQLHRPFAQVNFGTSDSDAATAAGVTPTASLFTATDAASSFDVFAGEGKDPVSVSFTEAALPAEQLTLKDGTQYTYLAMNYFIPTGKLNETHVSNLTATFKGASDDVVISVPSAKVQANYRTNIVGNLLTDQVVFNVEIVPAFEQPDEDIDLQNISKLSALKTLVANGGSAKLVEDIEIDSPLVLTGDADVTIDLNGHSIVNKTQVNGNYTVVFNVTGSSHLTINGDGEVKALEETSDVDGYRMAIWAYDNAVVDINGGYFYNKQLNPGTSNLIYVMDNAVVNIAGGKFETAMLNAQGTSFLLNIYDAHRATAKIKVTGGQFVAFNPADCTSEGAHTNFLAPGYVSSKISDTPEIYKVAEAPTVVVKTAAELATMLTTLTSAGSGNNIVEVVEDIQLAEGETWVPVKVDGYHGAGVITVKGNGHTIKGINAPLFAGGFAGKSGIVVKDLTLENVAILDNGNLGVGAFVGSIDSMEKIELNNCHLLNSTITTTGDARTAGLIGWTSGYNNPDDGPVDTYITVRNCSVEGCTITAKGSVGAIIGHAGANPATYHTIENNVVKNCTLHSTDDGGWRVGVVVGTANVGEVTIKGTIESGNTLIQDGKTAPAGQSNLYGRFVPGTTGTLTIDGVAVTL